jgi:hypothetical protein
MTTNPFYNALFAIGYIVVLVSGVMLGPKLVAAPNESILYPMVMLSLLVLSVALMAYLFFYQPVVMLLDGKRDQAAKLFLHTVGIFAAAIIILLLVALMVRS